MNCPKCNGSSGFTYNLIMKTNRIGDWGLDDDEETDVECIRDVKTVTCMDCKKRIDWDVAHGLVAVESTLAPDVAGFCACENPMKKTFMCVACGLPLRPAGKA
jgi:hypothetical protein